MDGRTRSAMHDVSEFEPYFHKDLIPDEATRVAMRESCPYGAIVDDRDDPDGLHLHYFQCNQCMRCQQVAKGAFEIKRSNFMAFLEVVNISAKLVLDTFAPDNIRSSSTSPRTMTPVCDCFGFTGLPVLPDAGIFGSNDIVAIEKAMLDMTAQNADHRGKSARHDGDHLARGASLAVDSRAVQGRVRDARPRRIDRHGIV